MQYLLTQEEFNNLKKGVNLELEARQEIIDNLCQIAADHVLVKPSTVDFHRMRAPYGCVRSSSNDTEYCDNRPVEKLCEHKEKKFTK